MAKDNATRPDTGVYDKEPAEGSREVIDRELKRQGRDEAAQGRSPKGGGGEEAGEDDAADPVEVMDETKGLP